MGKFAIVLIILSSFLLLACASGAPATTSTGQAEDAAPYDALSLRSGNAGESGPEGPAGPASPAGVTGQGFSDSTQSEERMGMEPAATAAPAPSAARPPASDGDDSGQESSTLQTAQRRVISTASISIEVEAVQDTVNRVRTIAEGQGGFVEQLSSSGEADRQQAHLTIRVPQDQFFPALERLEDLGEVRSRNVGSEDVSERFIDLEARLRSSLREEESLLNLLERATQVSEILTIERELNRVRSEIERVQGQLNFLERRVELATISISLHPPEDTVPEPPSASLVVEQSGVSARVDEVKNLVSGMNGEVDRVLLSVRDGQERADISFRVFPADFTQAVEFLESSGTVRSKDLREGAGGLEASDHEPESPNAVISVTFLEPEPADTSLLVWIGGSVGGAVLIIVLVAAFYFTYQSGRRRRDRYAQAA